MLISVEKMMAKAVENKVNQNIIRLTCEMANQIQDSHLIKIAEDTLMDIIEALNPETETVRVAFLLWRIEDRYQTIRKSFDIVFLDGGRKYPESEAVLKNKTLTTLQEQLSPLIDMVKVRRNAEETIAANASIILPKPQVSPYL